MLIDSPPTLGGWVMNIMCASDFVVIPVEASPCGLFGLANMFDFIKKVKEISPRLEVMGIMITKADERKKYFKETLETLKESDIARIFENYVKEYYEAEADDLTAETYDLSYYFGNGYTIQAPAEQFERQLFAQYPDEETLARCVAMQYFDREESTRANLMWSDITFL